VRVAILFIDGVGIGAKHPENPLTRGDFLVSRFDDGSGTQLPCGGSWAAADTTFGVPGRPQSASNQTAIYTALPAPQLLGEHVLGYPDSRLLALLNEHSIVRRIRAAGRSATFANAYPAAVLEHLGVPARPSAEARFELPAEVKRRLRASASTLAMAAGNVAMRTFADLRAGAGLTHDIDGATARKRGLDVPELSPERAAEIFWRLAEDFTLFEHYLADEAGHARDLEAALRALRTFDGFARAVIASRPQDAQIFVCSDHGNVEDLSTRSHTTHPVPVLAFGPADASRIRTVADVGGEALRLLGAV
jgi:hypothetical protein